MPCTTRIGRPRLAPEIAAQNAKQHDQRARCTLTQCYPGQICEPSISFWRLVQPLSAPHLALTHALFTLQYRNMASSLLVSSTSHYERALYPTDHGVVGASHSSNALPIPSRIASVPRLLLTDVNWGPRFKHYVHAPRLSINNWLSIELLSYIFLYAVEACMMTPYQLVAVCRRWRNVINSMTHLWSTLRLGTWTEIENIHLWLEWSRDGLLTVKVDPQRDTRKPLGDSAYAGLQYALKSMNRWQGLVVASTPIPEAFGKSIDIQGAMPLGHLACLELGERCLNSATLTDLLDHISKTAVLLSYMSLQSPYAISSFLQPQRHHILNSVTTLIINGRGISRPVPILPQLVRLQTFEASHLLLPTYDATTTLPFLSTLKQLKLRAVPIQWMIGRQFKCLKECTIIHAIAERRIQNEIDMPCCRTLTYEGHPIGTLQYFHAPKVQHLVLNSYDTRGKRVQRHLDRLCRTGHFSQLHTLHLTLWCSEEALIDILKYMVPLQELVLSIAYPTSWEHFMKSLAAEPSTTDPPDLHHALDESFIWEEWEEWHSSQIWHVNVLPSLKYLGIQSHKGLSHSECLDNCPLFRLVAWTRAQLTPPLEHLKVWEGRGASDGIVVDYISTGYLDKYLGTSSEQCDRMIVSGMVTQKLAIDYSTTPLFKLLHSSVLFRQLMALKLWNLEDEVHLLPYLEQLDELDIVSSRSPTYSLDIALPCVCAVQQLRLTSSTFSWMIGRTFNGLKQCTFVYPRDTPEALSRFKGLQVDMPVCTNLAWFGGGLIHFTILSCPNVQTLQLQHDDQLTPDEGFLKSLMNCSSLQELEIITNHKSEPSSLFQLIFCEALQQGAWQEIRKVNMTVYHSPGNRIFNQMVGQQQKYEKWWKRFTVSEEGFAVTLEAHS
jgi:hypothetical protein